MKQTMRTTEKAARTDRRKTAAGATDNPALWSGTYWGAFRLAQNPCITGRIIENRNRWAVEWRLIRQVDAVDRYPATGRGEDFDHAETYKAADGWLVLVVSLYGGVPPPVLGMVRIAPIYSEGVQSWAARYASRRELRARLEACEAKGARTW